VIGSLTRIVVALVLGLLLVAPMTTEVSARQPRFRVVATFSIIGDLTKNVGGDRIELATVVGADGDTERYDPNPGDALALGRAQLILENGLGSEPWLDRVYRSARATAPRVRVSEGIDLLKGDRGEVDPHFWHDVGSAMQVTRTIGDTLAAYDPANADTYYANADSYIDRLQALDGWVLDQVSTLPQERRKLVTSHDTFGYFARRYGFQIVGAGLESFFTDAQPSASRINRLVQDIRAAGVAAVFVENVTDPRLMQRLASEAGVRVAPQLYTDSLGAWNSPASTYVDLITHNVSTIVAALNR
jgi:zinc/manganese transport system substrate-binding protein